MHDARILIPRRRWLRGLALLALCLAGFAPGAGSAAERGGHALFVPLVLSHPLAPGAAFNPYAWRTGEGTYYDANGTGNCSLPALPAPVLVAAINAPDYAVAAYCGAYAEVTGPLGTVVVKIVDKCPECRSGDLDLSPAAFDRIANRIDGRVPIRWRVVHGAVSGPVRYHFKDGSNQWWTGIQIRNHRTPILKLEYQASPGVFRAIERLDYNYFVATNMGPGPYALRVTDIYGRTVTDTGVPLLDNAETGGASQFPP